MSGGDIVIGYGTSFGVIRWGEIKSFCGQHTPRFFTTEQGIRNILLGATDPVFHPWAKFQDAMMDDVWQNDLPHSFRKLREGILALQVPESIDVDFQPLFDEYGQIGGHITIGEVSQHESRILTCGMGIPMLDKMCRADRISTDDALYALQSMLKVGITESFSPAYSRQYRPRGYAHFVWETLLTERVINEVR